MIKLNILRFLLVFLWLLQSFEKIKSDLEFKCVSDGLFEDENDCEAYFECMWIGTAFEKQEHNRCADKLIYNPRKHRCDNVYDFETQFSKGIQTGEELLEFMRYRNCIESKNIITNSTQKPKISINTSNMTEEPTDSVKKQLNESEAFEFSNSTNFITVEILSNALNENLKSENSSLKNDEFIVKGEKTMDDFYKSSDTSKKGFTIFTPKKMTGFRGIFDKKKDQLRFKINLKKTFLDSNLEMLSSKKNKTVTSTNPPNVISSTNDEIEAHATFITHRRRRLLSLDNLYETTVYDETTEDDMTPTTLLEDEIESTDEVYHDKDEIVHQFSNKVMSKLKNNTENSEKKRIIDSIEETLSKRFNNINASEEYLDSDTVSLKSDLYTDNNFSIPLFQTNFTTTTTTTTTTKLVQSQNISHKSNFTFFNPFKRPLKFLKMLPKLNLSTDSKAKSNDMLSEILNITSRLINELNSTKSPQPTEIDHQLEYEETDIGGVRGHKIKKMSTQITKRTTEMETHYTTFFPHKPDATTKIPFNMTTILSGDQTKPTMQTYKINPNKKLPNQFASLRLNYDQDSLVTKIDEIERGGKFQRLRLVPADTLIECKENDFGLECSCSITLSPPKCKQLINSFLSSCRILGCKNNGKCINMAFKYPIPYVCSCPSDFMGSYCEMPRNFGVENDFNELNTSRSTTEKSILKNINVVVTQKPIITTRIATTQSTTKEVTTEKTELKIDQVKEATSFTEPLCNPNPCMNNAKCFVTHNSFLCLCSNASYTGKYCENFRNIPKLAETTKIMPKIEEFTTKFVQQQTSKKPYYFTTTPRAYIWQCPSNCFYNFGRGYCTLSTSGTPHCVCRLEWTGVDCSQKNYCLTNRCEHNSTCSNYPEMKSYLCICQQGYSGRFCEIPTMAPLISQNLPVAIAQKLLTNIDIKYNNESKKSLSLPIKNPCEEQEVKCKNNATCLMSFSHAKNKFGFICICKEGFTGQFCENKLDIKNVSIEIQTAKISKPKPKTVINYENPCKQDPDICRKNPLGNDSYTCVKSFLTQDYTLCLSTKSLNCKESNPCLNGGYCIQEDSDDESKSSWRCECSSEFTGRLCETEICTGVHKLFTNHTMCRPDSPNLNFAGINSSDIELIVDMHNNLRRQVLPSASNMQQVYWDVRLQHLAQKRAQLCSVENTGILMRQQPGYGVVIGENLAAGYEKWSHVLTSWMGENKNFIYKSSSSSDNLQSGHYTQMIYSSAARIGCGFAMCSNSTYERYFVCFYGEMQTYHSRYEPYQEGRACSACEKSCNNGLCDCKGAYCLNGGTMDLNTCTCTCPYSTFSGKYCENVICPKEDSPFCSQTMFEDKCWLYPVVRATCPYMCSLCTKNSIRNNTTNSTMTPTQIQRLFKNEGSYFN